MRGGRRWRLPCQSDTEVKVAEKFKRVRTVDLNGAFVLRTPVEDRRGLRELVWQATEKR